MHQCQNCKTNIDLNNIFCPVCGTRIDKGHNANSKSRIYFLSVIVSLLILCTIIYIWYIRISSAENFRVEEHYSSLGKVEQRMNANITNNDKKDVVILSGIPDQGGDKLLSVVSFNSSKLAWDLVYQKVLPKYMKIQLETCRLIPGVKDQIIVKSYSEGTGRFLDYALYGWMDNEMKTYLERRGLPMGKVEIQDDQLLEVSSTGNRVYKWSGNSFITTMLASDPAKPIGSEDVKVEYQIIDDHTVRLSSKEVTMFVGQKLYVVSTSQRRAARVMYSGPLFKHENGVSIATIPGNTIVQILPTYGGWSDAGKISITVKEHP